MFLWRLLRAACLLSMCSCLPSDYEDAIELNYGPSYYNEISEEETPAPTPTSAPCSSSDLTKWDKMFSMLENSQMRENMLLQYADDIIKVEIGSLRSEMLRFVAQYGDSCWAAVENAGRKMGMELGSRLRGTFELLKHRHRDSPAAAGNSIGNSNQLETMLQELLSAAQTQASRLSKLETSCFNSPGGMNTKTGFHPLRGEEYGHREQEVTTTEVTLDMVLAALQEVKVEMEEALRSSRQRLLPAGCEMALLFPMRSSRIYTSIIPDVPVSLSSFTICMWIKPTTISNKTALFTYGNRRNPYEIQLLLKQNAALFTIGGEAHLVEAQGVVNPGRWTHLCGAWSSEQGLASIWADSVKVASTPGVAEGHILPDGGSLQLGQERNGCCPLSLSSGGGMVGFEAGFDSKLAFAGKMTGVNMWDKVLSEDKISQLSLREGHGCEQSGNIVAWGVTEMVPHGGAQFIY